jgi:hypothetical protein
MCPRLRALGEWGEGERHAPEEVRRRLDEFSSSQALATLSTRDFRRLMQVNPAQPEIRQFS